MKLTIIPTDGAVYIDDKSFSELSLKNIPPNIHALQVTNGKGWIEFNDGTPNQEISALPEWVQGAVDAFNFALNEEKQAAEALQNKPYEQKLALVIYERNRRLAATDWTELPSVVKIKGESWSAAWQEYRQELRDMPNDPNNPIDVDNPIYPIPPAL